MAPRALSMMSSASPISQCGRRAQVVPSAAATSRAVRSPQVRTVTLASSPPTGTSGSAGFGIRSSRSSSSASVAASSASISSIRAPARVEASRSSATSGPSGLAPPRIASPICLLAALRSAFVSGLRPGGAGGARRPRAPGRRSPGPRPCRSRPGGCVPARRVAAGRRRSCLGLPCGAGGAQPADDEVVVEAGEEPPRAGRWRGRGTRGTGR